MLWDQEVISSAIAMNDAEQPKPGLYREAAEKLRALAVQSQLADIQGDLEVLAARFERMAAYYDAQRSHVTAAVKPWNGAGEQYY